MRLPLLAVLAVLPVAGCSISQPSVPVGSYLGGDYVAVRTFAETQEAEGDVENLAIVLNVKGQCQLALGDVDAARQTFQTAAQIMGTWATSGNEVTAAIVGSESSKTYKGDPYEKAMNAFYLSYCYLQKGEPDNARAALKRGILMDGEVADEKFQADNALLFWMAGRMSRLFGASGAEDYFKEAQTANTFSIEHDARGDVNNAILASPEKGNLVLLLPIGLGPKKFADGREKELARFSPQSHPAVRAQATLDGESLGRSWILNDVDYQASTLGGTAMEGIRKGKAVFKRSTRIGGTVLVNEGLNNLDSDEGQAAAIVGGALLVFSALTSSAADVRHWPTLPSTVQVLVAEVPPGEHDLVVDFLDGSGRPLPQLQHTVRINVPSTGEAWFLIPSLPPAAAKP